MRVSARPCCIHESKRCKAAACLSTQPGRDERTQNSHDRDNARQETALVGHENVKGLRAGSMFCFLAQVRGTTLVATPGAAAGMIHTGERERLQQLKRLTSRCLESIRQKKQNHARRQRRLRAAGSGTAASATTLAVYQMSGCIIDLAAQYWCRERQERGCTNEDCSLQRGRVIVQEWIDALPLQALLDATENETPAQKKAHAAAVQFLASAGAAVWATRMIKEQGHAPSTEELWHQSARINADRAGIGAADVKAASSSRLVRQWGWRWRRVWGFRKGKLRVREHYDTEELREKAGS